jgi:SAM-dependent methyltransferase
MAAIPTPANELKSIVESGYDHVAAQYTAWVEKRPAETRDDYLAKLIGLLPKGATVLELGCGGGVPATKNLVDAGLNVTGVDISGAQIAIAKERVPGARFVQTDMMSLEYPPASLDAIVAFYAFFHLPHAEQGPMMTKMVEWLKPGGHLLFNLHGKEDAHVDINEDWMGARMFSAGLGVKGNRDMFRENGAGLDVIEDQVAIEKIGGMEEKFHWVFAIRK